MIIWVMAATLVCGTIVFTSWTSNEGNPVEAKAQDDLARGVVVNTTKFAPPTNSKTFSLAIFREDDYPYFYNNLK